MSAAGFQVVALDDDAFAPLATLDGPALAARGVRLVTADEKPGFPCRVSLVDAEPGERVWLLTHTHHDVRGPYRASGPVYVRRAAVRARPAPGEVPLMLRHRLLSLRAYDAQGWMRDADVCEGGALEALVERLFADPATAYLHVHNARPGCFNCAIHRAAAV